ncbi:MAG: L,D-transpeptidase family protein [Hydrogenovibrio sp.]
MNENSATFSLRESASFRQAWWFFTVSLLLSLVTTASAEDLALQAEKRLLDGFTAIQTGQFEQASADVARLAKDMPEYQLAQLMKAELLAIRAGQSGWVAQNRQHNRDKTAWLMSEARVRWQQQSQTNPVQPLAAWDTLLSQYVLKTSQEPFLVIVDADAHRLHLYRKQENGYEEVVNYYVTLGEKGTRKQVRGDLKTPIGVYKIEKELPDSALPELYGVGALTLDYPNIWDRQQGRTGSGIWLHGTPRDTYSRAPLASRGCVVLNNPAMEALVFKYRLLPSTPVIIAENTSPKGFIEREDSDKQQVLSKINRWLREETPHQVDWADVSVYAYPGEEGLYYVSFPIDDGRQVVEQYWQRSDSQRWQLVLENQYKSRNAPKVSQNLALSQ